MSNLSPRGGSVVNAHFFHKCNSLFQKCKTFKKMHACRISLQTPDQSARALKRRHASTPKTTGQGSIETQMLVFAAVCACKPQSLNMPRQHDAKKTKTPRHPPVAMTVRHPNYRFCLSKKFHLPQLPIKESYEEYNANAASHICL